MRGPAVSLCESPRPGLFASRRDQKNFVGEVVEGGSLKDWIDNSRFLPSLGAMSGGIWRWRCVLLP
jgi:hypothetical protein